MWCLYFENVNLTKIYQATMYLCCVLSIVRGCGENNFKEKIPNPTRSASGSIVFTQHPSIFENWYDLFGTSLSLFLSFSAYFLDVPSPSPASLVGISGSSLVFPSSPLTPHSFLWCNPKPFSFSISSFPVTLISLLSHLSASPLLSLEMILSPRVRSFQK